MTEAKHESDLVRAWLDARGRFNLVSLVVFMPTLMYLKILGLNQGTAQELARFNRFGLSVIAVAWLLCLVWHQLSGLHSGTFNSKFWLRLRQYLGQNLFGLLLALMFLADLIYWPLYLGALLLVFALRSLIQPSLVDLRPVRPLFKTTPMPPFKRSTLIVSAIVWLVFLVWGFSQLGRPFKLDRNSAAIRANMQTLQVLVENYHHQFKRYPDSLSALSAAIKPADQWAWTALRNPFDGQTGYGHAYLDYAAYRTHYLPSKHTAWHIESVLGIYVDLRESQAQNPSFAGLALYHSISPHSYTIYGTDIKGELVQVNDQVFTLIPSAD